MSDNYSRSSEGGPPPPPPPPPPGGPRQPQIVIQNLPPQQPWMGKAFLRTLLVLSIIGNFMLFGLYQQYYPNVTSNERYKEGDKDATDKIALIKVTGMITNESIAAPKKDLETAAKDTNVKAVVLLVDSPGGTIAGSDQLYKVIEKFKATTQKPVVVSMQGLATSGAYYISVPADIVYAERSCITGSIGVIASLFNVEKLMKEWGVSAEVIKSGSFKDSGSPFRAMTEEERKEWQQLIDSMYQQFLGVILKYRADEIGGEEKLRQVADGRVYLAEEAKKLGLIDEVGYQDDAIEAAKRLANLGDNVKIVTYSRPLAGLVDLLGGETGGSAPPIDWRRLAALQTPRLLLLPSSVLPLVP